MKLIIFGIFLTFFSINVVNGLDKRLQTANIDFINVESNNRKQQPRVSPNVKPKETPKVAPVPTTTAKSVPVIPPKDPKKPNVVVAQTTTTKAPVPTTPISKVKQLAKNYDDRVSEIGKEASASHKSRFNLTQSEFPALPKSSGNVATPQHNPGSRTWASVVASDKQAKPSTKI